MALASYTLPIEVGADGKLRARKDQHEAEINSRLFGLDNAIAGAAAGLVRAASLPSLNATAGTRVGQPGEVTAGGDKGSYRWSGSAWVRVGELIDAAALSSQIAEVDANASAAIGALEASTGTAISDLEVSTSSAISELDVTKADEVDLHAEGVLRRTLDGTLRGNSEIGNNSHGIVAGAVTEDGRLVGGNEADGSRWDGPVRNGILGDNSLALVDGARSVDGRVYWGADRFGGHLAAGCRTAPLGSNNLHAFDAVVDLDGRAIVVNDAGGPVARGCVYEDSGDIWLVRGTQTIRVTTTGNNRAPAIVGNVIQWISTRRRGVPMTYQASLTDPTQHFVAYSMRSALEVIPATGQSLLLGVAPAISKTPINGAYKFSGGPVGSVTVDMTPYMLALKEEAYETISSGMLSRLIAKGGVPDLLFAGQAHGGYTLDQIKKGASDRIYERVMAQMSYAAAQPGGAHSRALVLVHGEADALNSNTNYATGIVALLDDYDLDTRAVLGQLDGLVLLTCQTSSASGYRPDVNDRDGFSSPIQQLLASQIDPRVFLVTTKYHLDYIDHAHLDALSTRLLGEYYEKVYRRVVIEGRDWVGCRPATFTRVGSSVVIDCDVEVAPLVIDTAAISDPGNAGFVLRNSGGVTITGISLTGAKQITVATSGVVPNGAVLSYALHNGTGGVSGRAAGARGCIRDSDPTPSIHTGAALRNWLTIFRKQF